MLPNIPQQDPTSNYGFLQNLIDPRHGLNQDYQQGDQSMAKASLGGFLNNAATGVGQLATGLLSLPGQVIQGIKDPTAGGEMLKNAVTGTLGGINDLVGQPVKTQNGEITGVQAPSIYEASKAFYKNPVKDVSSYYAGKGLLNIGKNIYNQATNPMGIDEEGNVTNAGAVKKLNAETAPPEGATPTQVSMFRQNYSQPTKMPAPQANEAYNTVISDGQVSGGADNVASHVQQTLDATEKIKEGTINSATKAGIRVPTGDILDQVKNSFDESPDFAGENAAAAGKYLSKLNKMIPQGIPSPDGSGLVASPTDLYHADQDISSAGWDLIKQGHNVAGDVINPQKVAAGEAFIDTSNAIKTSLDQSLGQSPIPNTPNVTAAMQQLQQSNPAYAQRLVEAPTFQAIRSESAPYVTMQKIIGYSGRTGNYPIAQIAQRASTGLSGGMGAAAGGAIGGAPGAVAGAAAGQALSPVLNQATNSILPNMTNAAVQAIPKATQALQIAGKVAGGVGTALKTAVPFVGANIPGNQGEQKPNAVAPVTPPPSPTNIPQTMSDMAPDKNGNYGIWNPYTAQGVDGASIAVSDKEYADQVAKLNQLKTSNQYVGGNPFFKSQVDNAIDSLNTKHDASQKLGSYFDIANNLNNQIMDARSILKVAPPNLLSINNTYDKLRNLTDPTYKRLAEDLFSIEKSYGTNLFGAQTADSAMQGLDQVNKTMLNDYYSHIKSYTGGSNQPAQAPQVQQLPSVTSQGLQNIQQGAGTVQGTPHPFAY